MCRTARKQLSIRSGFTLVELLLAVVLVLLLFGAVVFNFSTFQRGASLDEGATQLEALLRLARAQASSSGRQVQISFEEDVGEGFTVSLGNLRVMWEPDPLGAPGIFADLPEAAGYVRGITELVSIEYVRLLENDAAENTGGSGTETNSAPAAGETLRVTFPPVAFFPDGSSDSTEITLASRNDEDHRRLAVRLAGVTGLIRRAFLSAREKSGEPELTEPEPEPAVENSK